MQIDKDIKRNINRLVKDIKFYMSLNNSENRHLNAVKFNCELINDWINLEIQKRGQQ